MKPILKHRILATLLTLAVFSPIVIQASHVFEKHKHEVCTAKDVKHFHEQEIECFLCCTPVELHSFLFSVYEDSVNEINFVICTTSFTQLSSQEFFNHRSARAPPSFFL